MLRRLGGENNGPYLKWLHDRGYSIKRLSERSGLTYNVVYSRIRRNGLVLARDNSRARPEVIDVLTMLDASGLTDKEVQIRAGLGERTIEGWRQGRKPTPFLVECVREAIKNSPGY